jgi:site-specific DNA recombinase
MYTRVSSEEQAKVGYSIPFQRGRLAQYAAEHDLEIVARYEDVHSAKEVGRPAFEQMLRYFEANPEIRDVLVHRLDRLSRNLTQYSLLAEDLGVRIHSVVEPAENSPAGHLQHGIGVVVARYHSENLTLEVKKGMRAKFEAGGLPGRAPPGYRNVSRTKTAKATVAIDETIAPVVRLLFERYATGNVSLQALALEAFDQGLKTRRGTPFHRENVKDILVNPFYVGVVRFCGEELRQKCDRELLEIDERLAFLEKDFSVVLLGEESAIEMASALSAFYNLTITDEQRKEHLRRVFKRIVVAEKRIFGVEYNPPFDLLLENPAHAGSKSIVPKP